MKKDFVVDKKYLNIPVCAQKEEKLLRVFLLDEEGKRQCTVFSDGTAVTIDLENNSYQIESI